MNRTTDKPNGPDQKLAKNFRPLPFAAMICFGLFVSAAFAANPPANIVAFDPPGAMFTIVRGITTAGVVAGQYEDSNGAFHGFTYDTSGNFVIIDAPGAGTLSYQGTRLLGVSESGEICGYYIDSTQDTHGYLRNTSGVFTTLNAPGSNGTLATGVNDSDEVAGIYTNSNYVNVGFLWTASSGFTTFAPAQSAAVDDAQINASGEIAGLYETRVKRRGFYRAVDGTIITFNGSAVATGTYVDGFNDNGAMTGFFIDATGWHGFVRQGNSFTEFDVGGSAFTEGIGINDAGTVTGSYVDASNVSHGFTRDRLGNVTLFDVPYAGKGANQGTVPTSINASGQVAGYFVGPLGNYHGFVRR
jgi:hypothetical protein